MEHDVTEGGMLSRTVLDHLEKRCPEAVLVRSALENALPPEVVDEVFQNNRQRQYHRKLLFSSLVQLLGLVVCRVRPSVHAAFQLCGKKLGISIRAVYDKLNHTEPGVSQALVRAAYRRLSAIVDQLRGARPALVRGFRTRVVDGNHLAATEHRLAPLRRISSGPLPGVAVVVYDRERQLIESVDLAEDAHVQERQIVLETLERVQPGDLWIADRNFCTSVVLWRVHEQGGAFIIRRHQQNVRFTRRGRERCIGRTSTGMAYETQIVIQDDLGSMFPARLIRVVLDNPTRDEDREIELFTNLPKRVSALSVAEAYRKRWDIEVTFSDVEGLLSGEIESLGSPRAALLAFCLALIAYNAISVIKTAMRTIHGDTKVEEEVSLYFVAHLVQSDWRALEVFAEADDWMQRFSSLTPAQIARYLKHVCQQQDLAKLKKHPRGPKKPQPKRKHDPKKPHVATARLLAASKQA
jgi:IS4 transposase